MDDLLTEKIKDPTFDISGTSTMRRIVTLRYCYCYCKQPPKESIA
jgi:hypothetical protein